MIVVADTTPLNYLVLIGQADVLRQLFTRVLVPQAVVTELRHPAAPALVRDWATNRLPAWLETKTPAALEPSLEFLGAGEREVIALAEETGADVVLIDEKAGRREAEKRRLNIVGTLALLYEAGQRNLLDFDVALGVCVRRIFVFRPRSYERSRGLSAPRSKNPAFQGKPL